MVVVWESEGEKPCLYNVFNCLDSELVLSAIYQWL